MVSIIVIALLIASLILFLLGLYAYKFKNIPAWIPFSFMVYTLLLWCVLYALEGSVSDPATKLNILQFEFVVIPLVPVAALISIIHIVGWQKLLTKKVIVGLLIVPACIAFISLTNGLTSWFITDSRVIETMGFFPLVVEYGPSFLLHTAYSYGIVIATIALLIWHAVKTTGTYRNRDLIVLAGITIPFIGNVVVVISRSIDFDITPIMFTFTGLALGYSLFHHQLLSLIPVARGIVMDISSDPILILDDHGRVVDINPALSSVLGITSRSIGKDALSVFQGNKGILDALDGTPPYDKTVVVRSGSELRYYECKMDEMKGETGSLGKVIVFHDITANKIARDRLEESESLYRAIFDHFNGYIFVADIDDLSVFMASQSFIDSIGGSNDDIGSINLRSLASINQSVVNKIIDVVHEGNVFVDEVVLNWKAGGKVNIELSATPIKYGGRNAVCVMGWDITERRQMEATKERVERIESIGKLAGGIAHDFNNLLTSVLGYVSMTKQKNAPGDDTYMRMLEAEAAIMQAKEIAQGLMCMSKGGSPISRSVSCAELLKSAGQHTHLDGNLRCELHIPHGAWNVKVDPGQMCRVFSNLLINAKDAMPEGGKADVFVENVHIGQDEHHALEPGRYVKITFKDEGMGIPKDVLPRIYEPYFTTKEKGYGMGLSVVYATITHHKGSIEVESEIGKGTAFKIYLPATDERSKENITEERVMTMGHGRVLVMDDEQYILDVMVDLLQALGYDVETVRDGKGALAEYERAMQNGGRYDMVILDLTNHVGMGGKEAMEGLLVIDPHVRAIVSSGYSDDAIMADHRSHGFVGVLPKPYTIQDLAKIMEQTMSIR